MTSYCLSVHSTNTPPPNSLARRRHSAPHSKPWMSAALLASYNYMLECSDSSVRSSRTSRLNRPYASLPPTGRARLRDLTWLLESLS